MFFLETIAIIIFWVSLVGLTTMILIKIPFLANLKIDSKEGEKNNKGIKDRIVAISPFKGSPYRRFLEKSLRRFRIMTLKLENGTSRWIEKLRAGSKDSKSKFSDNFWSKIENNINKTKEENTSDNNSKNNS